MNTLRAAFALALTLLGATLAFAQSPATQFTLTADEITLEDQGAQLTLRVTGDFHLTSGSQTFRAPSGILALDRVGGSDPSSLRPISAITEGGRCSYSDSAREVSAEAGAASYSFQSDLLHLSRRVHLERRGPQSAVLDATDMIWNRKSEKVEVEQAVTALLSGLNGFSGAENTSVRCVADRGTYNLATGLLVILGAPATLTESDLTFTAPTLTLEAPGGVIRTLSADGGITATGDLEGTGETLTIAAAEARYLAETHQLVLTGDVVITRGEDRSTATEATLTLGPTRSAKFKGLQLGG